MAWLKSWAQTQERELRADDAQMMQTLDRLKEQSEQALSGLSSTVTILRNKEKGRQKLQAIMDKKSGKQ